MNKTVAIIMVALVSSSAIAKVTYEEAVKSSKPYYDSVESVHIPVDREGINEDELIEDQNSANQMGKWVKLSSSTISATNAGDSVLLLTPAASGQTCLKGDKGLIMTTKRECVQWNSGGWHCVKYGPETLTTNGYKAECR